MRSGGSTTNARQQIRLNSDGTVTVILGTNSGGGIWNATSSETPTNHTNWFFLGISVDTSTFGGTEHAQVVYADVANGVSTLTMSTGFASSGNIDCDRFMTIGDDLTAANFIGSFAEVVYGRASTAYDLVGNIAKFRNVGTGKPVFMGLAAGTLGLTTDLRIYHRPGLTYRSVNSGRGTAAFSDQGAGTVTTASTSPTD
jgi:hypothetical protein